MRILGRIAYWLAAVALQATILTSLDYTLAQAIHIGLTFCPCALALEFLMPKAKKPVDKVYLSLAVLLSVFVLILILHYFVWAPLVDGIRSAKDVAPMLINPTFLGLILTMLAIGDYFWAKWLAARFRTEDRSITFFSDRKSVTLRLAEIAYIESNDTEVRIVTASDDFAARLPKLFRRYGNGRKRQTPCIAKIQGVRHLCPEQRFRGVIVT